MEPLPLITSLQLIICFLYNLREASFESRNYKVPLYSLQENKEIPPPPQSRRDQRNSEARRRVAGTVEKGWEEAGFWQNGTC